MDGMGKFWSKLLRSKKQRDEVELDLLNLESLVKTDLGLARKDLAARKDDITQLRAQLDMLQDQIKTQLKTTINNIDCKVQKYYKAHELTDKERKNIEIAYCRDLQSYECAIAETAKRIDSARAELHKHIADCGSTGRAGKLALRALLYEDIKTAQEYQAFAITHAFSTYMTLYTMQKMIKERINKPYNQISQKELDEAYAQLAKIFDEEKCGCVL